MSNVPTQGEGNCHDMENNKVVLSKWKQYDPPVASYVVCGLKGQMKENHKGQFSPAR